MGDLIYRIKAIAVNPPASMKAAPGK